MKTAIVYYSEHHGNTKKLLDAIAAEHDVILINVTKQPKVDLSGFDRIGLASGIYYGGFAKQMLAFAHECLPQGAAKGEYRKTIRQVLEEKHCREIGAYWCRGFDTFGPFKLVGGVAKDHPTAEEIKAAVDFYAGLPE